MSLCIPSKVLDQHLVVLGKTGAGKSSALRHIVEHLLDHKKRVCIVDPKGDWWGLKSAANGNDAGYPIIAFGDFKEPKAQDVPINAHSGAHVAELITSGNRPCVIGFRGWTTAAMTLFWIDFAAGIFNHNAGELFLVGDEFHNFAPKGKIIDPQAGKCLHWSNRLLSEGRGLGIVCLLASQRPQKVHNDTLTSCETLIAMRVIHAADRGAIEAWIEGCGDRDKGKEVLNSLAGLPRAESFIWSPEIGFGPTRIAFPMFRTFDSFAPPQLQKRVNEKGWAGVDLTAVREKLAEVIGQAKADDPKALRTEIAELKRQLAARQSETKSVEKIVEVPVLKNGQLDRTEKLADRLQKYADAFTSEAQELRRLIAPTAVPRMAALPSRQPNNAPLAAAPATRRNTVAASTANADGESLAGPEQRILDAMAWLESIGVNQPEDGAVAFVAGYSPTSTGYTNPRGNLRKMGLIEYLGGDLRQLSARGRELANKPDAAPTGDELRSRILHKLPGPERRILMC